MVAPLKGRTRARLKAQFKYSDERGEVAWYRLTDVVRATIIHKTLEGMYHCLRAIVEDCELEIVEYNDRYMKPMAGGYRDLQLAARYRGHVVEIQVNTAAMLAAKQGSGHRTFAVIRSSVQRCRRTARK